MNVKSNKKKIVIVGGSYAGFTMAEYLWDSFDVTIIDKKDHFEYVASSLKCTVDDQWTYRNSIKYDDVLKGYQGRIKYQQGELINMHLNDILTIRRQDKSLMDITYDILILCTGYIYDPPVKEEKVIHLQERRQNLKNVYDEVMNAKSILVAGGGLAGVELISELCCKYPDKKLAICTPGNRLLNGMPGKAHTIAEDFLRQYKVELLYNTPYMDEMRNDMDYEVIIKCTGQKFNSDYLKENFPYCRSHNGMIFGNEYMQMSQIDPDLNPSADAIKENVFVFGDICKTRIHEVKNIPSMKFLAPFIYENIVSVALCKKPEKKIPMKLPIFAAISLGPNNGIFIMNEKVMESEDAGKSKFDYTDKYISMFKGDVKLIQDQKLYLETTYKQLDSELIY